MANIFPILDDINKVKNSFGWMSQNIWVITKEKGSVWKDRGQKLRSPTMAMEEW